tara:strand:- start:135 stop:791 length:657 start_codon:yes stop_codon:yes gene_type:complete
MKILLYLSIFFLISSCVTKKGSYWCGDHPCINKEEKEAYFKKTMIVEVKEAKNKFKDNDSEFLRIMDQAHKDEKERKKNAKDLSKQSSLEEEKIAKEEKYLLKQARLEEKRKAKEEKYLLKQARLEEKRKAKEEKYLLKQARLEENRKLKEEKIIANKIKKDEKKIIKTKKVLKTVDMEPVIQENLEREKTSRFTKLVNKIIKRNRDKLYPDINDIPE